MESRIDSLIDEEIQQLQRLKELAAQPRILELMRRIVEESDSQTNGAASKNGHKSEYVAPRPKKRSKAPKQQVAYGALTDKTREVVAEFEKQSYTVPDVVEKMIASGFRFKAKNPRMAVHGVLAKLIEEGSVTRHSTGSGRTPSEYRNV